MKTAPGVVFYAPLRIGPSSRHASGANHDRLFDRLGLTAHVRGDDWDAFLRQEPPRMVPSTLRALALRGERRWQVSLALLTMICAVMLAVFFPWPVVDDIRLDVGGRAGRGAVLESVYARRTLGDDALLRKRHVFLVRFRFEDVRAREHEATSLILGPLAPGTEVDVEFLPSSPSVARVRNGFLVPGGMWEVLWSAGFIALSLFGIWNYRRWRRRRLGLLIHGVPVPGVIERAWRDYPEDDTRDWVEVSYAARDGPVRLTQTVGREAYRRACEIVERRLPVRVLHALHVSREHIVLELMH